MVLPRRRRRLVLDGPEISNTSKGSIRDRVPNHVPKMFPLIKRQRGIIVLRIRPITITRLPLTKNQTPKNRVPVTRPRVSVMMRMLLHPRRTHRNLARSTNPINVNLRQEKYSHNRRIVHLNFTNNRSIIGMNTGKVTRLTKNDLNRPRLSRHNFPYTRNGLRIKDNLNTRLIEICHPLLAIGGMIVGTVLGMKHDIKLTGSPLNINFIFNG